MVKKMLINNGWKQKTIRITLDYNRLCDFLSFAERKEGVETKKINDYIFNYSLDYIVKNEDEIYKNYKFIKFRGKREPKGFLLRKDTLEKLYSTYSRFKNHYAKENIYYSMGEFTELLLYIWCQANLKKEVLDFLNINWGITKEN